MRLDRWSRNPCRPGWQNGLTLMELITALAISAILLAAATPSIQQQMMKYRLDSESRRLFTDLQFARMHAITHQQSIVLCPDRGDGHCADPSAWQAGWLIFRDEDRDRNRQTQESIVRFGVAMPQLTGVSSSGRNRIRFLPDGSAAGSNLTIRICSHPKLPWRRITLSNSGRLHLYNEPPPAACN